MHSGGKGISKSSLPYKRSPPSWLKISAQEVTEHVCKLAKKGLTPSQVCGSVATAVLVVVFSHQLTSPKIQVCGRKRCGPHVGFPPAVSLSAPSK